MTKFRYGVVGALGAVALTIPLMATVPAAAASGAGAATFKNQQTRTCLKATPKKPVTGKCAKAGKAQTWKVIGTKAGRNVLKSRMLKNAKSGKCLTGHRSGKAVSLRKCSKGNKLQRWSLTDSGLTTNDKNRQCLKTNGRAVWTAVCRDAKAYRWTMTKVK
ncbi:ricin-type beta-trefoil lectin domain protein [Actinomycetota bacterium Odt1-20B]